VQLYAQHKIKKQTQQGNHMWNRRHWSMASAAAVGAWLAAGPLAAQTRPAAQRMRVVVAVDSKSAFCYLPFTLAERLGYFALEGLDVQVRELANSTQAALAVLANEAQILCGPFSSTLYLHARGQWLKSFVLQGRAPHMVFGVSQRSLGRDQSAQDLRGKKIGVMALGSASHQVARLVLQRAGVSEGEVQFVALDKPQAAVVALRSGQIDAICHRDLAITELEQRGDLRVVADLRTLRDSTELFGGPWAAGCLSAPAAFVEANVAPIQALANGMVHALKWLQTAGPSDLIKAVPQAYFQGDRALYLAAFLRAREAWSPDGLMPDLGPATVARVLDSLTESGGFGRLELAQTFTNAFASRAKAKFKA
jgi:NitT/TauT family transport system substrate-binding protein